jgi:hypothetical protein
MGFEGEVFAVESCYVEAKGVDTGYHMVGMKLSSIVPHFHHLTEWKIVYIVGVTVASGVIVQK